MIKVSSLIGKLRSYFDDDNMQFSGMVLTRLFCDIKNLLCQDSKCSCQETIYTYTLGASFPSTKITKPYERIVVSMNKMSEEIIWH